MHPNFRVIFILDHADHETYSICPTFAALRCLSVPAISKSCLFLFSEICQNCSPLLLSLFIIIIIIISIIRYLSLDAIRFAQTRVRTWKLLRGNMLPGIQIARYASRKVSGKMDSGKLTFKQIGQTSELNTACTKARERGSRTCRNVTLLVIMWKLVTRFLWNRRSSAVKYQEIYHARGVKYLVAYL